MARRLIRQFPAPRNLVPAALKRDLIATFGGLAALRERNPFGNSVKLLALDIGKRLDSGALDLGGVEDLIQELTGDAFQHRARRLAAFLGERDRRQNRRILWQLIYRLAGAGVDGRPAKPFAEFKAAVERTYFGLVVTAHPTFGLPREMSEALTALAMKPEGPRRRGIAARLRHVEHRPPENLDLAFEHEFSLVALTHIQKAWRDIVEIALAAAEKLYPKEWRTLSPALLNVASWVGYDLDGRADIKWSDSLVKRLKVQAAQLAIYRDDIAALAAKAKPDLALALGALQRRLERAIALADSEIAVFSGGNDPDWTETLRRTARAMHRGRSLRLLGAGQLLNEIDRALPLAEAPDLARPLLALRAAIATHGLGLARTHVRLNAVQIHNAIRKSIGMAEAPDDPAHKRSYMAAIAKLLSHVEPVEINFASILAERTSAKRLFMIVAQMLKYVDRSQPVRFLIAETETPLTLLAALYFAKLFGIADRLDISPLFETVKAFERGIRVIDECLQNPTYAAYIRARGRLAIQTGFSDAGRHLGQSVAAISAEWLRLRLAELLRDRGFGDIEIVFFNTHGESIGRGGHPENLRARLDYVASPASRYLFRRCGIAVIEETSFQGGDGYLPFLTKDSAFACLTRILETLLPEPANVLDTDPLYVAAEDSTKEFFIAVRRFNEQVMSDPAYAALLDMFGGHLLFVSGSRPQRRQQEGLAQRVQLAHPSDMRAIPHNGILQQLGYFANTLGGVGQAIAKDPDRFRQLYRASPRLRRLIEMVEWALAFTDLEALKCYIDLYDPGQWLSRAYQAKDETRARELRHVAEHLEAEAIYEKLARIYRVFQRDLLDLRNGLAVVGLPHDKIPDAVRQDLRLLHGLRVALLMRLFLLTARIPDFSDQHDISREQLIAKIFHLEIDAAMEKLTAIFPKVEAASIAGDFGEKATYVGDWRQSYEREHRDIFIPIAGLYRLARRVSSGIVHIVGALG